jgi:hypothetical protein
MAVKIHADKQDDPKMTRRLPVVQCFHLPDMMPCVRNQPRGNQRRDALQPSIVPCSGGMRAAHFLTKDGKHHGADDITPVSGRQHLGDERIPRQHGGNGRIMPLERDYSVHLL